MISFVTLFLGLVLGTKPVEVAPGAGVASVEIRLDGQPVALLEGPPWRTDVDFGTSLRPHILAAVAHDAAGHERERAIQRLNVYHPMVEASLVLLPGTGGTGRIAKLTWTSAARERPDRVRVMMDGQLLPAPDPSAIALPPYRTADAHLLRAELDFPGSLGTSAEMVFGGQRSDAAQAELTAVPATFERPPPKPAEMAGWFLSNGAPTRVAAVDEGPGDIVLVPDEAALEVLARLPRRLSRDQEFLGLTALDDLERGQRLWLCWPVTRKPDRVAPGYEVFLRSAELSSQRSLSLILNSAESPDPLAHPRFADAVAMAGIWASAGNNPRAVVLFLGSTEDASTLAPETVRDFLAALNVPLLVWTVPGADPGRSRRWGPAAVLRTRGEFVLAARALIRTVAAQKVVWLDGLHLPQTIRLGPKARKVALAR